MGRRLRRPRQRPAAPGRSPVLLRRHPPRAHRPGREGPGGRGSNPAQARRRRDGLPDRGHLPRQPRGTAVRHVQSSRPVQDRTRGVRAPVLRRGDLTGGRLHPRGPGRREGAARGGDAGVESAKGTRLAGGENRREELEDRLRHAAHVAGPEGEAAVGHGPAEGGRTCRDVLVGGGSPAGVRRAGAPGRREDRVHDGEIGAVRGTAEGGHRVPGGDGGGERRRGRERRRP
mmetsp:Transcript_12300/g.56001  ORF Transcript_12300/g.56001 Transcript_12300/m.56001 type:complete len:230 (+) Transcript_12300:364-1053(+)